MASSQMDASIPIQGGQFYSDEGGHFYSGVNNLTGWHTWNSPVDMDDRLLRRPLNFPAYLDMLAAHDHNGM